jgi:pimeloyl-ACP methyl ester carboxylesterase
MADARRRRRWLAAGLLPGVVYLGTLLAGVPFGWPFDWVVNAGWTPAEPALCCPADGARRVVVLQHGMFRSSWALGRLARTCAQHGYEVHNLDYPSTAATLQEHAARLAAALAALARTRPIDELSFVGHSMGGLVIQGYLRRPDALPVHRCVYVAVPHRGALLADLRRHWFLFRWVMGERAAVQLSPGDPFHRQPIPVAERSGVVVGDVGDGNASIPGHDDRTVAVAEAHLPGAAATWVVPFGHTAIAYRPEVARGVLWFLAKGEFPPEASGR